MACLLQLRSGVLGDLIAHSAVILYYDPLITLSTEVSRIWSRPRAKASLWFFVHRGVPLIGHVAVLVYTLGDFTPSPKVSFRLLRIRCDTLKLILQLQRCVLNYSQTVIGLDVSHCSCRAYTLFHQLLLVFNQTVVGGTFSAILK